MMDQDNITWTGARAPGVGGVTHRVAGDYRDHGPAQSGATEVGYTLHYRRRQTKRGPAYAGSRLKLTDALGRSRLISQPSSRGKTRCPADRGDRGDVGISKSGPRLDPTRPYASCAGTGRSHGRPTARVIGVLLWSVSGR